MLALIRVLFGSAFFGASVALFATKPTLRVSATGGMVVGLAGVLSGWSQVVEGEWNSAQFQLACLLLVLGVAIGAVGTHRSRKQR